MMEECVMRELVKRLVQWLDNVIVKHMSVVLGVIIVLQVWLSCINLRFHLFAILFQGYWNFQEANPDGCQQCTCNPLGTVDGGGGCNEETGECQCKPNVARVRDCDQCLPEHYGLSESDPNGCKACDCDPGGSYDNQCDVVTGQCKCRPNIKVINFGSVSTTYFFN